MIAKDAIKVLRSLGLTEYETRAYVALASVKSATPREVAGVAGMPYPSAYDALESLARKGWVDVAGRKPRLYRARPPDLVKKDSLASFERAFKELKELYESSAGRIEKPEIVYTIIGKANVVKRIQEMLSRAREEVFLVLPSNSEFGADLGKILAPLIKKGVKLKLITDSKIYLNGVKVRLHRPVLAVDVLVDEKEALISLPDFSACGWVENPTIAGHFRYFIKLLWRSSKSMKSSFAKKR